MSDTDNNPGSLSGFDELGGDTSLDQLFAEEGHTTAAAAPPRPKPDMSVFSRIPVRLTLEVDSAEVMLGDLLDLEGGEVLPLSRKVGDPLDVRVNGQLIGTAEVVEVDGRYGLRLLDVLENLDVSAPAAD